MYKSGTGTRGRGHWDACVGTWDLGTRGEGRGDIRYGTRGRMGRRDVWDGDAGTSNLGDAGGKVEGKRDISFFVKMCYLTTSDTLRCLHKIFLHIGVSALTILIVLSTVSKHLLLDLLLKICQTK